jgi:SprT-like family protein
LVIHFFKFFKIKRRRIHLKVKGEYFDLKAIYDQLNDRYFENKLDLSITWFGNKNALPRSRIRLGSYHPRHGLIKIHRLMDKAHVPHHFIAYVIYHEMLHHVLPPIKERWGRRKIHHPEFTKREKQFQEYTLAEKFEKSLRRSLFSTKWAGHISYE